MLRTRVLRWPTIRNFRNQNFQMTFDNRLGRNFKLSLKLLDTETFFLSLRLSKLEMFWRFQVIYLSIIDNLLYQVCFDSRKKKHLNLNSITYVARFHPHKAHSQSLLRSMKTWSILICCVMGELRGNIIKAPRLKIFLNWTSFIKHCLVLNYFRYSDT